MNRNESIVTLPWKSLYFLADVSGSKNGAMTPEIRDFMFQFGAHVKVDADCRLESGQIVRLIDDTDAGMNAEVVARISPTDYRVLVRWSEGVRQYPAEHQQ